MLIADALSNFDGKAQSFYPLFNQIGNFFVFFFGPVIPIFGFSILPMNYYLVPQNNQNQKDTIHSICG